LTLTPNGNSNEATKESSPGGDEGAKESGEEKDDESGPGEKGMNVEN